MRSILGWIVILPFVWQSLWAEENDIAPERCGMILKEFLGARPTDEALERLRYPNITEFSVSPSANYRHFEEWMKNLIELDNPVTVQGFIQNSFQNINHFHHLAERPDRQQYVWHSMRKYVFMRTRFRRLMAVLRHKSPLVIDVWDMQRPVFRKWWNVVNFVDHNSERLFVPLDANFLVSDPKRVGLDSNVFYRYSPTRPSKSVENIFHLGGSTQFRMAPTVILEAGSKVRHLTAQIPNLSIALSDAPPNLRIADIQDRAKYFASLRRGQVNADDWIQSEYSFDNSAELTGDKKKFDQFVRGSGANALAYESYPIGDFSLPTLRFLKADDFRLVHLPEDQKP